MHDRIREEANDREACLSRNDKRLLKLLRCELHHGPGYFQFGEWVEFVDPTFPYRKINYCKLLDKTRARLEWLFEDASETCFYVYDSDSEDGIESHEIETIEGSGDTIARRVLGDVLWGALRC